MLASSWTARKKLHLTLLTWLFMSQLTQIVGQLSTQWTLPSAGCHSSRQNEMWINCSGAHTVCVSLNASVWRGASLRMEESTCDQSGENGPVSARGIDWSIQLNHSQFMCGHGGSLARISVRRDKSSSFLHTCFVCFICKPAASVINQVTTDTFYILSNVGCCWNSPFTFLFVLFVSPYQVTRVSVCLWHFFLLFSILSLPPNTKHGKAITAL